MEHLSFMMKKNKRWRQKQIPERHSLSFMMNREQLCGAYRIKCQEVTVFPWRWRTSMRRRRNQIGERHSLYLMMEINYVAQKIMNNFAVLTKWAVYPWRWITVLRCRTIFWREGTVFPCYEEQLCGAEDIICWEARSINNDEEQLCGAEEIKYPENRVYPWRRKIFIYAVLTESNAEGASLHLTMKSNCVVHKKIKCREGW